MTALQRSIIETLAYFDLFDYPLTLGELYRYAWCCPTITLGELHQAVRQLPQVQTQAGVYFLSGRENIVELRAQRYLESERKYKKRLPYIHLLTYLPYVEAIFVVNTLAYQNVRRDSDIDLLIITRLGKIWTTRFFTTALAKLLRLRPRPHRTQDMLCLSFYLDAAQLNLQSLNSETNDRHQAYWLNQMFPVFDPHNFAARLLQANLWVKHVLPQTEAAQLHPERMIPYTWRQHLTQVLLGVLGWEQLWKTLQLWILPGRLKQLSGFSLAPVILSDHLLKFHTHDPRPELTRRWQKTVGKYLSPTTSS